MRIRIEINWDDLVRLVGHAKARGLCRNAVVAKVLSLEDCAACLQSMTNWNAIPPWEKK